MVEEIEYRWSGQVMEPVDGLAFIGRNPADADNVFIATGDSGMGMTHGTIAGMLLSDLVLGREDAPSTPCRQSASSRLHSHLELCRENLGLSVSLLA